MSRITYVIIDGDMIVKAREGVLTSEYLGRDIPKDSVWHGYGSDNLPGGVNGIINHADGQHYDSKSRYEQAVKAKGCRIVGNDWNKAEWKTPIERGVQGDYNVRPQLQEAVNRVLHK